MQSINIQPYYNHSMILSVSFHTLCCVMQDKQT